MKMRAFLNGELFPFYSYEPVRKTTASQCGYVETNRTGLFDMIHDSVGKSDAFAGKGGFKLAIMKVHLTSV